MSLAITGWSVLCSAGIGVDAFTGLLDAHGDGASRAPDVRGLYEDALPAATAHAFVDLNVRATLGRKNTTSLDRRTVLALIACRDALGDGGVRVDDETRHRIGVTLGTTWGSLKAMSDYTKESLLEDRPYLVEPARFPNTVMNCAAGQAAIWFGLKGVNATIAGGHLAFLNVIDYTANLLRCGYADTILAGAVEEFTPHNAWANDLTRGNGTAGASGSNGSNGSGLAGEAAAVFVIERADEARAAGRRIDADVLSVATGFAPGGAAGGRLRTSLAGCLRRALARAGVAPEAISVIVSSDASGDARESVEAGAVADVFGNAAPVRLAPRAIVGDCQAAMGAMQVASLLAWHRGRPARDGAVSLITGWTDDGGVGAAVVKGWNRAGSDRG